MPMPLHEQYIRWLYSQVASVKVRTLSRTYWKLLRILFTKEFIWTHPRDENRAKDGVDLRREFVNETGADTREDPAFWTDPCDMLELLIVLARKLSFDDLDERDPEYWFMELLQNLDLNHFNDATIESRDEVRINNILDAAINHVYPVALGGRRAELFPLNNISRNARNSRQKPELLIQAEAYLAERV